MPDPSSRHPRYVVLPTHGLHTGPTDQSLEAFLRAFNEVRTTAAAQAFVASHHLRMRPAFRVVDSIAENGAKLVEMTAAVANELKANQPGLRIEPVREYYPARVRYAVEGFTKASSGVAWPVEVVDAATGGRVAGARVVAFTNFASRVGAQADTDGAGPVGLNVGGAGQVERLFVYGPPGYWGATQAGVPTNGLLTVRLAPLDHTAPDAVGHYYGTAAPGDGAGVTVGVIDTGVGPHPHLAVAGGACTVVEDGVNPADFADTGDGHGTHVAGIIAATGVPPAGRGGVAPGVTLRSYRVFANAAENPAAAAGGATSYSITKAILRAVADGCHLVNVSLAGPNPDPGTADAVAAAWEKGTVVFAAAGNDGRGPVGHPAAGALVLAVSALGVRGTWPAGSSEDAEVAAPFGTTDPNEFLAAFSNVGGAIDLAGPGVGVVSAVPGRPALPGGGYAPMNGTSMACPAVVGFTARLLARNPAVLALPPSADRSDQVARLLLLTADPRGFLSAHVGNGLPL